ncbi:MAG: GatB/YqeY domain-containing protein [Arenicella sp.]
MSLKETLLQDMKTAMREKDAAKLECIRMLRAAIQRKEVDDQIELNEEQSLAVLQKLVKQGQESIKQFEQGDRQDLAAKEQAQLDILNVYMPAQLDESEVDALIEQAINSTGATEMRDMGKVVGMLKGQLKGRADMSKVSGKVKARLS